MQSYVPWPRRGAFNHLGPQGTPLHCSCGIAFDARGALKRDSVVRNEVAGDVGQDARHAMQSLKSFGMARRAPFIGSLANGGGKVDAQVTGADAAVFCVHRRTEMSFSHCSGRNDERE